MKMFTKFSRLMTMLLLSSAFIVVQAQSGKQLAGELVSDSQSNVMKTQVQNQSTVTYHESHSIADLNNLYGEVGDSYDPAFNTDFSQPNQKGTDETDDLILWVLPTNGGTSGNTRAPGNAYLYQRTQYLITAADMAASGFPTGALLNSIGFYIRSAGVGTQTGTLNIWLMNTTDVTYGLGSAWTTAGFTQVSSNPSFTVPIEPAELVYDEPFVGGSPFTYTGDGVYVAWEFSGAGPTGTTAVVHWCNTTLASGLYGNRSNVALPTSLTASNWRPATRFGTADYTDVLALTNVYTLGKVPVPFGTPTPVDIRVENVSPSAATFDLTLEVRDVATNTLKYTSTQAGINLAATTVGVYNFTGWTPSDLEEVYVIGIASPAAGENWLGNNTVTETVNINDDLFSFVNSSVASSGWGWTYPGDGIFASKHMMNGSGLITGVNIFIYNTAANAGNTVFGCVLNSAGTIVAQSADYIIQGGDLDTWVNFPFPTAASFTNEEFYIGLGATAGTAQYYPLGIIAEIPQRGATFYNFLLTGGTPTENTANYKRMIEAQVEAVPNCDPPTSLNAINITETSADLTWTSNSGLSDIEFGETGFTQTGIPTDPGETSPFTKSSLDPGTSYSFYVRDDCGGINSIWVGPYTFITDCQVICPGGSLPENEAQIANDATDVTNGGCNMLPNTPLFTPIASGDTYCGETNTYTTGGGTGEARDTDWYRFEALSSPGAYWNFDITVTAEFNSQLLLIDAGADDCTDYSIVTALTAGTCETINLIGDYPSGVYYIWVGPQAAAGNPYPYGTGPYNYVLSYTGTELGAPEATFSDLSFEKTVVPGGTDSDVLTIGNIGNYVLNYSAITTGTYNLVWEDMFDTYAAGVQLAVQSPDWTTWSGSPGSTEDPFVSNAFAFSGANSAEITGTVDAVREYGNLTSGSYRVSNMMYVVPGNVGYYNTLLTFDAVGAVYEWGMQVAFETDGTATLDAGVFAAATFAYTPGTWMLNEVYVDLDNDYAEYWFNGAFVHSWQWSIGTGGYTTNQLAANNFYAYTGAGGTDTPLFYIDDVKLEVAVLDWLTIDGGLGVSGSIADGGPDVNLNLAFDATGKAVGTYTKNITITTNELGAKTMSYSIPVTMYVGYKLTGNVYYGNTGTKSMAGNTTVTLTPGPTVNVGTLSEYEIRPLDNGNYLLAGATTKPGNNAQITTADGILTTRIAAGVGGPYSTLQFRAADVNASNGVTTSDAILVKRRAAGLTSPFAAPVFVFDGPFGPPNPVLVGKAVTINNGDATMELRCLLSGDVNSSHTP